MKEKEGQLDEKMAVRSIDDQPKWRKERERKRSKVFPPQLQHGERAKAAATVDRRSIERVIYGWARSEVSDTSRQLHRTRGLYPDNNFPHFRSTLTRNTIFFVEQTVIQSILKLALDGHSRQFSH